MKGYCVKYRVKKESKCTQAMKLTFDKVEPDHAGPFLITRRFYLNNASLPLTCCFVYQF